MALTQISTQGIKDGTITGSDLATNVDLVDNQKLRFGAGNDLQIFHDGSHSRIVDSGTGHLIIQTSELDLMNAAGNKDMIKATQNGSVELYFDNSKKFETKSSGVQFHGDTEYFDNLKAVFGNANDLQIYHDATHSYIVDAGTGELRLGSNSGIRLTKHDSETLAFFDPDGGVELYHDNSKKFDTNSGGVKVHGNLDVDDNNKLRIGTSSDLQIFHDGGHSYIHQDGVGTLRILADNFRLNNEADSENVIKADANGGVELYYDNSKKFETTSAGATVTGFLGIGITNPDSPLEVLGTGPSLATIHHSDGGTDDEARIMLGALSSNPPDQRGAGIAALNNGAGHDLLIKCSASHSAGPGEKVRVRSDGNVGINQTNPSKARLHVVGDDTDGDIVAKFKSGGGGADSKTYIALISGYPDNANDTEGHARIGVQRAGSGNGTRLLFETQPSSSTTYINALKIDEHGRTGVHFNSTTLTARFGVETTANTMVPVQINDSSNTSTLTHRILFSTGGTEVGRIRCTNSETQYNTSGSDRGMKKNFESWDEDVLSLFKNINPQKFNFIQEEDGATKSKGFIAQEIANSFPEAYSKGEEEDDKYWFNPSGMVVYLMKAIQELEAEVAALKAS